MFYILNKTDNKFLVFDTDDLVAEKLTYEQLCEADRLGYRVENMSGSDAGFNPDFSILCSRYSCRQFVVEETENTLKLWYKGVFFGVKIQEALGQKRVTVNSSVRYTPARIVGLQRRVFYRKGSLFILELDGLVMKFYENGICRFYEAEKRNDGTIYYPVAQYYKPVGGIDMTRTYAEERMFSARES